MSQLFHQVAKILDSSFSVSPSNEHRGLISFRVDWLDLLAVQGTLQSLLQHHSSDASVLDTLLQWEVLYWVGFRNGVI